MATKLRWRPVIVSIFLFVASPCIAQQAQDFYRGKKIDLTIGYSVGGGYDIYARLIARHLGSHIPGNPTIVPRNLEGAASLRAANFMFRVAPRDGTAIATIGRATPFDPLFGIAGGQFDATKFGWLGSANDETSICVVRSDVGVTSIEDAMAKEVLVGSNAASDDTAQFPKLLNGVLGTKFKVVTGYPGGNDILLAMERGEVQGRCGWSWSSLKASRPSWLSEGKIRILAQLGLAKHPELPDVPLITDFAHSAEEGQLLKIVFARQVLGRPFLTPPDIPADRLAVLQKAFADTLADPALLADAEKQQLEIVPASSATVGSLVRDVYDTAPALVEKLRAILAR